ncbi:putative redox-active protein with C_GCAxxG_C_C motif [Halanaerobium saccharolyticum]|uniref:Putative redox-active protein with C_GCAxxG_C_C motif n=1 Tax=Halanaerobium saccharolyticum TaxID=43595 RepID=A0A4R7Z9D8_9FIRM|nr:C-GCAxxG-C-C family (seleno)protein [Halanaerobium saccharolyticum]RAK12506.1 putative redox-active protein with C_GCAxxG_C_C motif [Halanaerobium saccharolyticum]TDW06432.1 putative redox-active protein with C_GCAxxG_C_C motif [Halanaerobium saccharolyticum]TDX61680.1 putative redox-active protein with C_GCAxxG_C_C motif [Halanaerobium saccharolyticum]
MKEKELDMIEKKARETEIRDDVCSRSTLCGLSSYFDFISEDIVNASLNLAGGGGAASGSCGAYIAAQLAVGLKFNPSIKEVGTAEFKEKEELAQLKMMKFRDLFIEEFGTTLCPNIQKNLFGKEFDFTNLEDTEEFFKIEDHAEKCGEVVGKTSRLAAEFIEENN